MSPAPIGVVVKGWPRLSETFVARELVGLEARGFDLRLIALRQPAETLRHPIHDRLRASVLYLPEHLSAAPMRVSRAWNRARVLPGWTAAHRALREDLRVDPSRNRLRRFGQALVLATEADPAIGLLYAHFLHTPASVARYAALLMGRPWAVSAHAKDIWTSPEADLATKLADCAFAVTCSATGAARLSALSARPVALAYHGLDRDGFGPAPRRERRGGPVRLLSVGRLVPKKGYRDLLHALARLPAEPTWHYEHVGGGVEAGDLRRLARDLDLEARITWHGPLTAPDVLAAYRRAEIFVLASRIADDGDRDGVPNVILEAMSQRLPCVATCLPAIEEVLGDGTEGLLVPPGDPAALAGAMARLIGDPALRAAMGEAAEGRVHRDFSHEPGLDLIETLLRAAAPCVSPSTRR
jgi:glycosyltransferase involved in cell wall biosynthesis